MQPFVEPFFVHYRLINMAGRVLAGLALIASILASPASGFHIPRDTSSANDTVDHPANSKQVHQKFPPPKKYGGVNGSSYHSPAFVPHGSKLKPQLSQAKTNGASKLGTHKAPKLPPFLGGSPLPHGKPWGSRTAKNTNYVC